MIDTRAGSTGAVDAGQPTEPAQRMCPSTPVGNATVFLGMITPARRVAYVTPAMPAEVALSQVNGADTSIESRYRFAGPCVTSSCGYWTGDHCGLGAKLAASYQEVVHGAVRFRMVAVHQELQRRMIAERLAAELTA